MPKQSEVCTVVANGEDYNIWKTVEITRSLDNPVVIHGMLSVAEISSNASNFSDLKLKPGDQVQVFLGDQLAINGFVYLRQAACDGHQHGVQIGVVSNSQSVLASTVDVNPGQYIKQTPQQMIGACFGKVGVPFRILGNPAGADMPFDRVSEHMGERRFDFAARICNMANLHMMDTLNGIAAFRGYQADSGLEVREGYNLLRGRVLLQTWDAVDQIAVDGMDHNQDSADQNRATQGKASLNGSGVGQIPKRPLRFAAEETGPNARMQMRANQEKDFINLSMIDGDLTVPGWFASDGTLWMAHVANLVSLYSPLLLPQNQMQFMIKGVIHRQSSEGGTTTDVLLCDTLGVGGGGNGPLVVNNDAATTNAQATEEEHH